MNFIKLSLTAAAVAALAAAASPALAGPSDDAFAAFKTVCAASGSDYTAALAAADAGGFKNTQITADTMPGVSITDKQARDKTVGSDNLALFVTRGLMIKGADKYNITTCTLSSDKSDAPTVVALAQKWLGLDPTTTTPTKTGFRYALTGALPGPIPAGGLAAAVAGDGLVILSVQSGGGKVVLDIEKFKK